MCWMEQRNVQLRKNRVNPKINPKAPFGAFSLLTENAAKRCGIRRADGGARTRTPVRAGDFKSPVSAIPPHPHSRMSIPFLKMNVKTAERPGNRGKCNEKQIDLRRFSDVK